MFWVVPPLKVLAPPVGAFLSWKNTNPAVAPVDGAVALIVAPP